MPGAKMRITNSGHRGERGLLYEEVTPQEVEEEALSSTQAYARWHQSLLESDPILSPAAPVLRSPQALESPLGASPWPACRR